MVICHLIYLYLKKIRLVLQPSRKRLIWVKSILNFVWGRARGLAGKLFTKVVMASRLLSIHISLNLPKK